MLAGVPTILITGAARRDRDHAAPAAGPPGPDPAPAGHRRHDRRACRGGDPRLGHRHGRHDGRVPRRLGRDPPGEHLRRGLLGGHPPAQHPGHLRRLRGGAAGGRAAGDLRVVQPRGRLLAAGELPGAGLRLPRARHLLRRGQGDRRGAGRPVPLQVRPGHHLHPHPELLPQAAQRPVAVHLAVPRRCRAAVRGLPDHAGPGIPGGLRRLGQHPRRLGQPPPRRRRSATPPKTTPSRSSTR